MLCKSSSTQSCQDGAVYFARRFFVFFGLFVVFNIVSPDGFVSPESLSGKGENFYAAYMLL